MDLLEHGRGTDRLAQAGLDVFQLSEGLLPRDLAAFVENAQVLPDGFGSCQRPFAGRVCEKVPRPLAMVEIIEDRLFRKRGIFLQIAGFQDVI